MRFPWRKREPDAQRFQQFGPAYMTRDARPEIRKEYVAEIAAISKLLFAHDPIGIDLGANTDEYDPEARTIVARLATYHGDPSLRTVLEIVHEEFVQWFGETAGHEERYSEIAQAVHAYWSGRDAANH